MEFDIELNEMPNKVSYLTITLLDNDDNEIEFPDTTTLNKVLKKVFKSNQAEEKKFKENKDNKFEYNISYYYGVGWRSTKFKPRFSDLANEDLTQFEADVKSDGDVLVLMPLAIRMMKKPK
jgi:hypothetical protein